MKVISAICFKVLTILLGIILKVGLHSASDSRGINERPIVGIPTMKISDELLLDKVHKLKGKDYIAASYVKFLEMAGARAVAIPIHVNETDLKLILKSVNGLLFPGGESNLKDSGYFKLTKLLFDEAVKINEKGTVFPILGICRGMQALIVHTVNSIDDMEETDSVNLTRPLKWDEEALGKSFLKDIPESMKESTEDSKINLTAHFHKYGFDKKIFHKNKLLKERFEVIATSTDRNEKEFVAIFQGKKLPFLGLQFHPEKSLFEWATTIQIPHSMQAIYFAQFLANMFVGQVKNNVDNRFKDPADEQRFLMLKDPTYYTGYLQESHSPFSQIYLY